MTPSSGRGLVQLLGSGLLIQATLSIGNFLVGLILVRHAAADQYGLYVLVFNALMLLTMLQGSFIQGQMVVRMMGLDRAGRADLAGGLMREQRAIVQLVVFAVFVTVLVLRLTGWLDGAQSLLILFATLAAASALAREYLRTVLFTYRRPQDVLRADAAYVLILLLGVVLASLAMNAAMYATLAMAAAAALSGMLLWRSILRSGPWNPRGARGVLRTFVPLGTWSVSGAAAYWALSQGYSFIVAGTLDVEAVATIAAARLPLMPLNLISAGLAVQLLPIAADWVHSLGVRVALRRLTVVSAALVVFACCYFVLIWILRERIFTDLFHKNFPQRDVLLLLWFAAFVLMLVRDQLVKLLVARERFPALASATVTSATLSLLIGYTATVHLGEVGAVAGILCGELVNIAGIVVLTMRELKRTVPAPA